MSLNFSPLPLFISSVYFLPRGRDTGRVASGKSFLVVLQLPVMSVEAYHTLMCWCTVFLFEQHYVYTANTLWQLYKWV